MASPMENLPVYVVAALVGAAGTGIVHGLKAIWRKVKR